MKRLHSIWTYPFVLCLLIWDIFVTRFILINYEISITTILVLLIANAIFLSGFVINILDLKKVFITDKTVYIYDLYSKIPYAVEVDEIVSFERDYSRYALPWGIFKLTVIVKGEQHTFKFMKNKLLNVSKYLK